MTQSNIARHTPRRALLATLGAGSLDKLAAVLAGQGLRVAVLVGQRQVEGRAGRPSGRHPTFARRSSGTHRRET